MSALGLHQLVPSSLLAGRHVIVLVCYLGDSGKDKQNPITTLAGYVTGEDAWRQFETNVEPHFAAAAVNILHAKELHHSEGDFEGWRVLRKQAFVASLIGEMKGLVPLGLTMSADKATYAQRKAETKGGKLRTTSPYTFCFRVIADWLLRSVSVGQQIQNEGLAFILETGHENNGEAEEAFYVFQKEEAAFRSISFVPKKECRAIQMADLIAFYSRRHGVAMYHANKEGRDHELEPVETMMKIISEGTEIQNFLATEFYD